MKIITPVLTYIVVLCLACFANPIYRGIGKSQKPSAPHASQIVLWYEKPSNLVILASFVVVIATVAIFIIKKKKK